MNPTTKQKMGCLLHERWKTEAALSPLLSRLTGISWPDLCNRQERILMGDDPFSRICDWQDSSFLTVARVFPEVGRRLMKHCLEEWPLKLVNDRSLSAESSQNPRMSVILPVGGRERIQLCKSVVEAFCSQSITDFEIIIVEHAGEPLYTHVYPRLCKYIFLQKKAGQQFNKSMAMNAGVRNAAAPYVLLHDADVVPPIRYVESILARFNAGWEAVRPFRLIFFPDRKSSEDFILSGGHQLPRKLSLVQQNNPGLSTALSQETYWRLGGHDERFEGWGGEDLEFLDRLRTINLYPGSYAPGVHLWHEPSPKKHTGDRNHELMVEIRKIPASDRILHLRQRFSRGESQVHGA